MPMNTPSDLRLGLTMRVVEASGYYEPRDALAHDWSTFMKKALPEAQWMPVPNIGDDVLEYVESWDLNGFVLTGGNNLKDTPVRDQTEYSILEYARSNNLPVLGVCRGLQMICDYYNQPTIPCPDTTLHVAREHQVHLIKELVKWDETDISVNSYHEYCVGTRDLFQSSLIPFAISSDGLVEGVYSSDNRMLGIMWHPERSNPASGFDEKLIRKFFNQ